MGGVPSSSGAALSAVPHLTFPGCGASRPQARPEPAFVATRRQRSFWIGRGPGALGCYRLSATRFSPLWAQPPPFGLSQAPSLRPHDSVYTARFLFSSVSFISQPRILTRARVSPSASRCLPARSSPAPAVLGVSSRPPFAFSSVAASLFLRSVSVSVSQPPTLDFCLYLPLLLPPSHSPAARGTPRMDHRPPV